MTNFNRPKRADVSTPKTGQTKGRGCPARAPFFVPKFTVSDTMSSLLLLAFAIAMVPCALNAQLPAAPGEEPAQPAARVRCWIFPHGEKDSATVVARGADKTEHQLASAKGVAVSPTGYAALAPWTYTLDLKLRSGGVSSPPIQFKDGNFYTVAAMPKGGAWQITTYFDGPPADKSAPRPVHVLNFSPGRSTVVRAGNAPPLQVPPGAVAEMQLPPQRVPVRVEVLAADGGPPALSTVEVDLKEWPCAYVVVSADYRGRMRPRVLRGGEEPEIAAP